MSNNIDKVTVVAKDGSAIVRTGNAFVKLEDESNGVFITTDLSAFVNYVNSIFQASPEEKLEVFVTIGKVECFRKPTAVNYCTEPIAKASIRRSNLPAILLSQIEKGSIPIAEMESTLHRLLEYGDSNVITLYNFTRNCNVSSITEFQRQVDDDGNYSLTVKREGKSDKKLRPVEVINFSIPILQIHKEKFTFPLKVTMDFNPEKNNGVSFKLSNYQLAEMIEDATMTLIDTHLKSINTGIAVFKGDFNVIQHTDSWKYKVI